MNAHQALSVGLLVVLRLPVQGYEATAIMVGTMESPTQGIWLAHYPGNTLIKIHDSPIYQTVKFSPDGKKIAFMSHANGRLYVMNNDGSEIQEVLGDVISRDIDQNSNWAGTPAFQWTEAGILFNRDRAIHRLIPETGTETAIASYQDIGSECENTTYGAIWSSRDGRKVWLSWRTKFSDVFGCDGGCGRGTKPYIVFNPAFTGFDVVGWGTDWGHGQGMTIDGHMCFIRLGEHRHLDRVIHFGENEPPHVVYSDNSYIDANGNSTGCEQVSSGDETGEYPAVNPPIPAGLEAGFCFPRCANHDSLHGAAASDGKRYFYNWKTQPTTLLGEFPSVDGAFFSEFWYGPLPNPHNNAPYIKLSTNQLVFVTTPGQTTAVEELTVTNISSGGDPLGAVSASVSPAGANWIAATTTGVGGNTQTVTVTITPQDLPSSTETATITVSGGGASNSAACNVSVYSGEAVAAPTNLSAEAAGDSLLDIELTWTDNATNETGYIIERKVEAGPWEELTRTSTNTVSHTDLHLEYDSTYTYRLRAFRDLSAGVSQESDNSNESAVRITGIPWIRVHSPVQGEYVKAGGSCTIRWTANMIGQVRIFLSLDGGRTFTDLRPDGGIINTSPEWGNYVCTMPDVECSTAVVRVRKYEGGVAGLSGVFRISPTIVGVPLPAGYIRNLLQLEKAPGGAGPECIPPDHAGAVESRYVGAGKPSPCVGEQFTVNGSTYQWHVRTDADGRWSDEANDNYVAYWAVEIHSPQQRSVMLGYRIDDNMRVWCNGEEWFGRNGWDGGSELTSQELALSAGANRLLFKLQEEGGGNWLAVRILDPDGTDATGLSYRLGDCATRSSKPEATPRIQAGTNASVFLSAQGNPILTVGAAAPFRIRIHTSSGRLLCTASGAGPDVIRLFDGRMRAGVYLLEGTVGGTRISRREVVR